MSRKNWIMFLCAAVFLSLVPNAAKAEWQSEAQCEEEAFPYSVEGIADSSFDLSLYYSPGQCDGAEGRCISDCRGTFYEELALCLGGTGGNPYAFAVCSAVVHRRFMRCVDQCQRRAIDCIRMGGGGGGNFDPFNRDIDGGGGGCGLSAEYAYSCWGP